MPQLVAKDDGSTLAGVVAQTHNGHTHVEEVPKTTPMRVGDGVTYR
jgi:hypothetical protein